MDRAHFPVFPLARFLLAAALTLWALAAPAQLPGFPARAGAAAAEAPAPPGDGAVPDEAAVRSELAAAQAELDRVMASPNQAVDAPPDVSPGQLVIRQSFLRQLVRAYQQRLDDMTSLRQVREQQETVERRLARFRIDPARAPYSMVAVEALRREIQQTLRGLDAATARIDSVESQAEVMRFTARSADQSARQLLERIEARGGPVGLLVWERELQLLRGRVAIASLDTLVAQRSLREEERALARTDLEFLKAQLALTEGKVEFSEKDRDTLFGDLDARIKALEPELATALASSDAARKAFVQARERLAAGPGAGAESSGAGERLGRMLALAELRFGTAQSRVNVTRLMMETGEAQRSAWGYWYDIIRAKDADTARQLQGVLDNYRTSLVKIDTATRESFRLTLSQINAVERELLTAGSDDAAFLRDKMATLRERAQWQARLLAEVMSTADLLDRWRAGFVDEARREGGGLAYWWHRAGVVGRAVWSFELFSAQDTIEVEGRKIVADRSITLGKIVSAVLLLVVGMWVARWAIRALGWFTVRYLKADANAAGLAGKWIFALVFVVLFLLSLMTVKIPFTVFAFLGGAVAIGVGFGMQTLLKNLISGMMLLIERPFRLGDIVEVGPVRGKITDINIRSSLIRDRNGIETLVPNSTFLEQNVTNWTYTLSRVRYSLNVGVAYGSPVDRVRDLLLEAAGRHGLVMRNPAPEVFLQDFGADALAFSLQYWLDLAADVDSQRVGSDLRYMIEKSFGEAGIVIAFPQRDVHLEVAQPIPVRVVAETGAPGSESR